MRQEWVRRPRGREERLSVGIVGEEVGNSGSGVVGELAEGGLKASEGDTNEKAIKGTDGTTVDREDADPSHHPTVTIRLEGCLLVSDGGYSMLEGYLQRGRVLGFRRHHDGGFSGFRRLSDGKEVGRSESPCIGLFLLFFFLS